MESNFLGQTAFSYEFSAFLWMVVIVLHSLPFSGCCNRDKKKKKDKGKNDKTAKKKGKQAAKKRCPNMEDEMVTRTSASGRKIRRRRRSRCTSGLSGVETEEKVSEESATNSLGYKERTGSVVPLEEENSKEPHYANLHFGPPSVQPINSNKRNVPSTFKSKPEKSGLPSRHSMKEEDDAKIDKRKRSKGDKKQPSRPAESDPKPTNRSPMDPIPVKSDLIVASRPVLTEMKNTALPPTSAGQPDATKAPSAMPFSADPVQQSDAAKASSAMPDPVTPIQPPDVTTIPLPPATIAPVQQPIATKAPLPLAMTALPQVSKNPGISMTTFIRKDTDYESGASGAGTALPKGTEGATQVTKVGSHMPGASRKTEKK